MPKFILTADSHLRESQYGIFERGRDFLDSLKNVVDLAAKHKAIILHAGDLLDTRDLKGPVAGHLHELDAYCISQKVRMLVIDGNHDHSDPPWAESLSSYRKLLNINGGDTYGMHSLDHKTFVHEGITVSGLPFMSVTDFRETVKTMPAADILMWHGMVAEVMGQSGQENMVSFKDLPPGKFKVFLVGDVHVPVVMDVNGTMCVSPGSTELCSKSEPFQKSVQLLTFAAEGSRKFDTLPIETRKAHGFRIMNESDVAEVIGKLRALAGKALVFVSHDPGVKDIDKRLRLAVDETQVILRCDQLGSLKLPPLPGETGDSGSQVFESADLVVDAIMNEEVLSPAEFLPTLLQDTALRQIATHMLGDSNPGAALGAWAENRLLELTAQTNVS